MENNFKWKNRSKIKCFHLFCFQISQIHFSNKNELAIFLLEFSTYIFHIKLSFYIINYIV